jgi:hypothetical protein
LDGSATQTPERTAIPETSTRQWPRGLPASTEELALPNGTRCLAPADRRPQVGLPRHPGPLVKRHQTGYAGPGYAIRGEASARLDGEQFVAGGATVVVVMGRIICVAPGWYDAHATARVMTMPTRRSSPG